MSKFFPFVPQSMSLSLWKRMHESFDSPELSLHACVRDNNIPKLRHLISTSSARELEYYDFSSGTPLQVAVLCDNPVAVRLLLDAGAEPLAENANIEPPRSALRMAIETGNHHILRYLWHHLSPGRDAVARNPYPYFLGEAAANGQASIVEDLLDLCDCWSDAALQTALQRAAANWEIHVINVLLSRLDFSQDAIMSALDSAIRFKSNFWGEEEYHGVDYLHQQQLINRLIDAGADPNDKPNGHNLVIQAATFIDLAGALKTLLERGADANSIGDDGEAALHHLGFPVPFKKGRDSRIHETGIGLLLDHGASVTQPDQAGDTPLHYAAFGSNVRTIALYCQHAISMAIANSSGETLIHWAAAGGKVDILRHLLGCGMDVNSTNTNGWTPLMCALTPSTARAKSVYQSVQSAYLLLAHGADPLVRTVEGWTVLHCLSIHLDNDPIGDTAQLAKHLLTRGALIEARASMLVPRLSRNGPWPFYNNTGLWGYRIHEVMKLAATTPSMVIHNRTPLHWAAYHGAVGVASALMAYGADASAEDECGYTPICLAVSSPLLERKPDVSEEVLQVLLRNGDGH